MKFLTLILLTLTIGLSANAKHHKNGKQWKNMVKQLSLTDDQKTKWKAQRKANKAEMKKLRAATKEAREAMKKAWADNASDDSIKTKHSAVHNAMMAAKTKAIESRLALRALLDDSQKKKFAEIMSKKQPGRMHKGDYNEDDD